MEESQDFIRCTQDFSHMGSSSGSKEWNPKYNKVFEDHEKSDEKITKVR